MISITGLDKAAVLAALYNASYPSMAGFLQYDPTPMTVEVAREMIGAGDDGSQLVGVHLHGERIYFDHLKGRAMKVDLSGDEFDPTTYNTYIGKERAEKAIAALITTGDVNSQESQDWHKVGVYMGRSMLLAKLEEMQEQAFSSLRGLMNGQYAERIAKGDKVLEQILPEAKRMELEQKGIHCDAHHMPSRKNPRLWFSFERKGWIWSKTRRVHCEIGKRRLWVDDKEEPLDSLEQMSQKIEEAVSALT